MLGFGLLAAALWMQASATAPAESTVGLSLLATVLTLGVLEHWLLILPLASEQPAAPLVKQSPPADPPPWHTDS
jgi:hypothetical protein